MGGIALFLLAQSWAKLTGSKAGSEEVETRERLLAKWAWVCLIVGIVSGVLGVANFQDLRWQLDDVGYRRGLTEGETYGRARGRLEYALDHAPPPVPCTAGQEHLP